MPILYFIEGDSPTPSEFEDAISYLGKGTILKFVSLLHLDLNKPMLKFSDVKGLVPEQYKPIQEKEWVKPKNKAK